jgi:aconitase B
LPPQTLDENVVTIIEKWESLQDLRDNLKAPYMLDSQAKVKDIVEDLSIKVLKEAEPITGEGREHTNVFSQIKGKIVCTHGHPQLTMEKQWTL